MFSKPGCLRAATRKEAVLKCVPTRDPHGSGVAFFPNRDR